MDGELPVLAAFLFELLSQTSAIGDDDGLMAVLNQVLAEFQGASFDASGVEFRKDLQNFHRVTMGWFRCGSTQTLQMDCSINILSAVK